MITRRRFVTTPTILALDLSLNGTGMAYRDGWDIVTRRVTVKKLRGLARLAYVSQQVSEVMEENGTDTIVVEDYAMGIGRGGGMTFTIGELGGVIKLLAYDKGMRVVLVSPATLKKFVTGKGNAKKDAMAEHALRRWGHTFDTDDECDAYCLYRLGEQYFSRRRGDSVDWSKLQTEKRSDSI